jgi:hypothetical protein
MYPLLARQKSRPQVFLSSMVKTHEKWKPLICYDDEDPTIQGRQNSGVRQTDGLSNTIEFHEVEGRSTPRQIQPAAELLQCDLTSTAQGLACAFTWTFPVHSLLHWTLIIRCIRVTCKRSVSADRMMLRRGGRPAVGGPNRQHMLTACSSTSRTCHQRDNHCEVFGILSRCTSGQTTSKSFLPVNMTVLPPPKYVACEINVT